MGSNVWGSKVRLVGDHSKATTVENQVQQYANYLKRVLNLQCILWFKPPASWAEMTICFYSENIDDIFRSLLLWHRYSIFFIVFVLILPASRVRWSFVLVAAGRQRQLISVSGSPTKCWHQVEGPSSRGGTQGEGKVGRGRRGCVLWRQRLFLETIGRNKDTHARTSRLDPTWQRSREEGASAESCRVSGD